MGTVSGKVAVVTGAAMGIGKAGKLNRGRSHPARTRVNEHLVTRS